MADGNTQTTYYSPRSDPNDGESAVEADFKNFVAWKHSGRAVWLRGANLKLSGAVLADNAIGATFASYETSFSDALFVGETANNAIPLSSGTPRRGYEFYDGTVGADRVTFVNYSAAASIPSSALGYLRNNGFSISTANYAGALQFVNANPVLSGDAARGQGWRQGGGLPGSRRRGHRQRGRLRRAQLAVPHDAVLHAAAGVERLRLPQPLRRAEHPERRRGTWRR